ALVFGVIGYIAHKTQYHVTAILIGVILGPLFEKYLLRSLRLSEGDPMILFSSTIGNLLWAGLVISLLVPAVQAWLKWKKQGKQGKGLQA
ncbi:MAG: C4-dicarboxylate ABC transporter permease, partial [Pseudomonadota bacterium]|nr:C4-dicarboxylate ABC transporter permease [Pseudomonadota bacterium]